MKIVVYGSGCKSCHKLHDNVLEGIKSMNIEADVDYVSDMNIIMKKGFMLMPVLEIDEVVVSKGKVLNPKEIMKLIK